MQTSDIISIIALCVSIIAIAIELIIHKKKLKIRINDIIFNEKIEDDIYNSIIIECFIENHNQLPITITNALLGDLNASFVSFDLKGDDIEAFNQTSSYNVESISLPFPVDGYSATKLTAIVFLSKEPINIKKVKYLIVKTTRGKIKVKVEKHLKNITK